MPGRDGDEIRVRLAKARLYLCTDARREQGDLAEFVQAVLAGGVDVIRLRDKNPASPYGPLEAKPELEALAILAEACERHDALLVVNDRADIALAADADLLHLGQADLPVRWARRIVGEEMAIGRSVHDVDQLTTVCREPGVDYFCVGPCWTSDDGRAPGLDLVRRTAELDDFRPWFAAGGVDDERLPELIAAGASRVVVDGAVNQADDPGAAASRLAVALR